MSDFFSDQLFKKQYAINRSRGVFYQNKTYLVFQGPGLEPKYDNDPWIMAFEHRTNSWSSAFRVAEAENPRDENPLLPKDDHGNPAMTIDSTGRIHVIYGGHGEVNNGEMRHLVSENAHDLSSWQESSLPTTNATYPNIFTLENGKLIYLYRGPGQHEADWYYSISNNHGETWSDPVAFLKGGKNITNDSWYAYAHAEGNDVHIAFTYHEHNTTNHKPLRYNSYYAKLTGNGQLKDITGKNITEPITFPIANDSNNQLRVDEFSGNNMFSAVDVDHRGRPFISFAMTDNNQVKVYAANWTGSDWNVQLVATHRGSDRFHTRTAIFHRGGDDFSLFSFGNNGKGLLEYQTTDGNQSWSSPKNIWSGKFDNPTVLWNPHSDAVLFFDDFASDKYRNGYLYGDSGFVGTQGIKTGETSLTTYTYELETPSLSNDDHLTQYSFGASNGQWTQFEADEIGDWVEFTLNIPAGTYQMALSGKSGRARGEYQLLIDGAQQGNSFSQYQTSNTYNTWDLGDYSFDSSDSYTFRFETIGQASQARGFGGSFDTIQLVPIDPSTIEPEPSPAELEIGLYDTQTNNLIQLIKDGDTLLLERIDNRDTTIAAFIKDDSGDPVKSMQLNLNDGDIIQKENMEPFALFGDMQGNYKAGSGIPIGNNTITFEMYSQSNLRGDFIGAITRNFTLVAEDA